MKIISIYFILLLFTSLAFAQQQTPQPVSLQNIVGNLYEVLDGRGARGGVFIGQNGILVIDSKQDENSVQQTIDEINKLSDKPIKYLVNTHSDGDHVTGNQFFPSTTTIVSHENCRKELFLSKRDGSPSDWNNSGLLSFVPSLTFHDKMEIYLGSKKVELWYFGIGHTTGDAVVYFPDEKVAFIGDQVFVGRAQLIHSYKGGNSFEHVKTLTRMLETLEAEKFYSGHSDVLTREAVQNHINEMKTLQEKVKTLIEKNKTLDEVKNEFEKDQERLIEVIFNELIDQKN
ncbi:MAG: MBL fold metallo-hydrolase [Prolixibacteraceae bacterium]|jgi:cyclase|nr:MBL fold metallo-hydrolase [Prolixibacteraceae bacterium]